MSLTEAMRTLTKKLVLIGMDFSFLLDVALGHGTDLNNWSSKVREQGDKPMEEVSKSQNKLQLTSKNILILVFAEDFPGGSVVKNLQETRVWSLGQENPLERKMAIHSSILAWEIPWTEEPSRLQSIRW